MLRNGLTNHSKTSPKRVNFIGIQNGHSIACAGYSPATIRTGYEQIVAHRTSDMYAVTAHSTGEVVSISDKGIVVKFDNGKTEGYILGRRFGNAAGLVVPHDIRTDMKIGQKFKVGDCICYNTGFFERDRLNPNNVVLKFGTLVKTVLLESTRTLEDSSAISKRVSELLATNTTKVKDISVKFDQSIHNLVKVGSVVKADDILCIIEDAVTANSNVFDEQTINTLRVLGAQTPQAKAKGVVDKIEFFYHGDKEDMSESLLAIANEFDQVLSKQNKAVGRKSFTGSVDDGFRVNGDPLPLDTANIRIYITSKTNNNIGDKIVFGNQMKSVTGEVLQGKFTTESGSEIDAIFGMASIYARIVNSPSIIGTTNVLLGIIGKRAAKIYRGNK